MLRDLDNFDFYTTPADRWTVMGTPAIVAGEGRNETAALRVQGNLHGVARVYDNQQTWIVHFAFKRTTNPTSDVSILLLQDGATVQVSLYLKTATHLLELRRSTSTMLQTGTTSIQNNTWYHVQLKVTIADAGSCTVKLNSIDEIVFSGDTKQSANAYASIVALYTNGAGPYIYYDDYILLDGQGAANNDFAGDLRVYHKLPNGAGNYAQWTPSAGANYQNVDENPPDSDTTYNSSSTAAQKDSFAFSSAGLTGTVAGVMCLYRVRKDDAGGRTIRRLIRIGGTDYFGDTLPGISDSYTYQEEVVEQDPSTTAAWADSGVDVPEYGYDLVS